MLDTPAPERIIEGTAKEILGRLKTLPESTKVRFEVLQEPFEEFDDSEHEKQLGVWDRVFAKADAMEFERSTEPLSPFGQGVVEKFRKQGLKV